MFFFNVLIDTDAEQMEPSRSFRSLLTKPEVVALSARPVTHLFIIMFVRWATMEDVKLALKDLCVSPKNNCDVYCEKKNKTGVLKLSSCMCVNATCHVDDR